MCTCRHKDLHVGQKVIAKAIYSHRPDEYRKATVIMIYRHTAILDFGPYDCQGSGRELWIVQHGNIKEG